MNMNNDKKLKELKLSGVKGTLINYHRDLYDSLKANKTNYFINTRNRCKFSPTQAVEIVKVIDKNGVYSFVELEVGNFSKYTNGDSVFINDNIRIELTKEETNKLADWLTKILTIGGYMKEINSTSKVAEDNPNKDKDIKLRTMAIQNDDIMIKLDNCSYKKLKEDCKDFFKILGTGDILNFSPSEGVKLLDLLEGGRDYSKITLRNGIILKSDDGSINIIYYDNSDNEINSFEIDKDSVDEMSKWLRSILEFGGWLKLTPKKETIEFKISDKIIEVTDGISKGTAICAFQDKFNPNIGKLVAMARMLGFDKNKVNKIIDVLFDEPVEISKEDYIRNLQLIDTELNIIKNEVQGFMDKIDK